MTQDTAVSFTKRLQGTLSGLLSLRMEMALAVPGGPGSAIVALKSFAMVGSTALRACACVFWLKPALPSQGPHLPSLTKQPSQPLIIFETCWSFMNSAWGGSKASYAERDHELGGHERMWGVQGRISQRVYLLAIHSSLGSLDLL